MSNAERTKWDRKYREAEHSAFPRPPEWLERHLAWAPRGRALDVACGLGGAARTLAQCGWQVTAIDISEVGIRRAEQSARQLGVTADWIVADLEHFSLPRNHFDLIVSFYYLERTVLPCQISHALRPGGMLLFETFTVEQLLLPDSHLKNRSHALEPGELLRLFPELQIRAYRELRAPDRAIASLAACRA